MRTVRLVVGAIAIFYVLTWGVAALGQAAWHSTASRCGYAAANQVCELDGRLYVSWTNYPYIRPILNGDVPMPAGTRSGRGNPRTRLALAMFSIYRSVQGNQLVAQADQLPRSCGGFYIELDVGPLLLPALKAVPSCVTSV
ncbi:hypothetical protein [Virgisporangium aurantiacum]|uniref:Uncharacterized protein n=1 Tax=Virgisporangium aurantiacum TaxID=175570 RepID=A0A8J4EAK5_9ACTN|nr:hypothetical protein [Virgisporangium aurantiacum]GIJ64872.1 hypothetical protein Vau01_123880 [Virgisporangium aurantiacum]